MRAPAATTRTSPESASVSIAPATTDSAPATAPCPPPCTAATTPVRALTDKEIAYATLLSADEYAPGWLIYPTSIAANDVFQANVAADIASCAPFLAPVFTAAEAATVVNQSFYHRPPTEAMYGQIAIVFADDTAATAMVDAISDPGFAQCASDYQAVTDVLLYLYLELDELPFAPLGDQMTFNVSEETWAHPSTGELHGPEENFAAVVRVGRTVTLIGALHIGDAGVLGNVDDNVEVVSIDQFQQLLTNFVNRAEAALHGTPLP